MLSAARRAAGDALQGVVIHQGHRGEAALGGEFHDALGRIGPVRGRAVGVEVDRHQRPITSTWFT